MTQDAMRLARRTITELVAHESRLCALFARRVRAFMICRHSIGKYRDITNYKFAKRVLLAFPQRLCLQKKM